MSQITDGLVNDGNTGHFSISYESSLSPVDGRTVAQGLMNVIEDDLALIREWFAGTAFKYAFPINVELHKASGGASWELPPDIYAATYHPTVVVKAVYSGNPIEEAEQGLDYVRYLLVAEVTEMFMASKDNGWFENTTLFTVGDEGSKGEGLSRFLGQQFMLAKAIAGPYPGHDVVNEWLTSTTRPNYVEGSPDDNQPDIVTGGTTCFLYYLHDQLGFSIPSIIDAGSTTLAGVYQKLTGRTDAWASFIGLVNTHYPVGTSADDMSGDDIFPVANLETLSGGVSVVAGQTGQVYLSLDRATPVSVTVQLTSDDAGTLKVPPSVTILHGTQDCMVSVVALPFGDPSLVTMHAAYAGATVSASVRVLPHSSVLGGAVSNDVNGGPIANAVVVLDGETGRTSPSHVHMQLLTGRDGSWTSGEIAPDTYDLEVTASGYVPARTSVVVGEGVPSTQWDVSLIKSQPFTVRGSVSNQSGAPLFGVAVTLIDDEGGLRLSTTTASDGTYGFTHDPGAYTGGYTLFAELVGHTTFQLRIPTISNGATVLQNLTLTALGVLTGLINDANSAVPVAGARVSAAAEAATSDATGRYTLQLAPGLVSVNVAAAGYEFAAASVTVAAAGTAEQNFTLVEASATLTGAVLDGNTGLGVRHAFVRVDGAGGVQASLDGAFTLSRVPAGLAQVVATAQGYRAETVPVLIVAHDAVSTNIYLTASGPNPHPPAIAE